MSVATVVASVIASYGMSTPAGAVEQVSMSTLAIIVYHGESPGLESVARVATLECDPAGGTHPHGDVACAALDRVSGNFSDLEDLPDMYCTADYEPVTVTVIGTWKLCEVNFQHTYPNACAADIDSGGVFAF